MVRLTQLANLLHQELVLVLQHLRRPHPLNLPAMVLHHLHPRRLGRLVLGTVQCLLHRACKCLGNCKRLTEVYRFRSPPQLTAPFDGISVVQMSFWFRHWQ